MNGSFFCCAQSINVLEYSRIYRDSRRVTGMHSLVELHVGDHCIETASRKKLKQLMDEYFEDSGPPDIEEQILILQDFIEQSDFAGLRSSDNRLSGEEESHVQLRRGENGKVVLNFTG